MSPCVDGLARGSDGASSESDDDAEEANEDDMVKSTIIMVGLSQHGKTATIDSLLQSQGMNRVAPEAIGNGNVRCTTSSMLYDLHQPLLPTRFRRSKPWKPERCRSPSCQAFAARVDRDEERTSTGEASHSRKMWQLWKNDQNYEAHVRMSKPVRARCDGPHVGKCLQFQVLDTPGLEDTHGGDIGNMANVIHFLGSNRITNISAVIMVTKCGAPFSPAWKRQVAWYWTQFPQLRSQWICLHTNADPIGFNAKERNAKGMCFERECMERQRQLQEVLREIVGSELDCLLHIFVENFIPSNEFGMWEPGQEALRRYQTNTHNRLYSLLAHFPMIALGTMPLVKGFEMTELDTLMRAHLQSAQQSMIETLREVEGALGEYMAELRDQLQQQQDAQTYIEKRERELKHKNTQDLHLMSSQDLHCTSCSWGHALQKPNIEGTVHVPYKLRSRKIASSASDIGAFVEIDEVSHGSWHVRLCGSRCRSIGFQCDMLAYTYRKDFHAKEIQALQAELDVFHRSLSMPQKHLVDLRDRGELKPKQHVESEKYFLECQDLLSHLSRDLSLEQYSDLAQFYADAIRFQWPAQRCCEELGSLLHLVGDQRRARSTCSFPQQQVARERKAQRRNVAEDLVLASAASGCSEVCDASLLAAPASPCSLAAGKTILIGLDSPERAISPRKSFLPGQALPWFGEKALTKLSGTGVGEMVGALWNCFHCDRRASLVLAK